MAASGLNSYLVEYENALGGMAGLWPLQRNRPPRLRKILSVPIEYHDSINDPHGPAEIARDYAKESIKKWGSPAETVKSIFKGPFRY